MALSISGLGYMSAVSTNPVTDEDELIMLAAISASVSEDINREITRLTLL